MKKKRYDQATRKAINLFFLLFLAIGSLFAGSVALFYRAELNTFLSEIKTREQNALGHQSDDIKKTFDHIVGDLIFLSRQNELQTYFDRQDSETKHAIQTEYIEMSRAKSIYDQIRYIDEGGMEGVRVNFMDGTPGAVPEKKLQNKARRYYFTDTIALKEKEIFVSPLDLNIENGKVEQPFKPMIRFGTPVFDEQEKKRGIVLLNYLARDLLALIDVKGKTKTGETMLLNAKGYWLLAPDKNTEWGFMLEDRAKHLFSRTYPEEWRQMRLQGSGQIQTKNGLFTFTTLYPLQEGFRSSSGSSEPYTPSINRLDPKAYFWVLVSLIPAKVMRHHNQTLLGKVFMIGAGLFILISYGAWQLALAITKRRIYQARLIEQAHYDPLTKLPNRKLFFDRLEEGISHASRHNRRLCLLYIDLDGFKGVNDTMGHDAGDELLVRVASVLKRNLRRADTAARLGGDEFAVILFEIKNPDDAMAAGEKLLAAIDRPIRLTAGTARVGASVGAAIFPDHVQTTEDLVKCADSAMYQAKAQGKNKCIMASDT